MLCASACAADASKPDIISFGSSVEAMASSLDPLCSTQTVRDLDPPPVPGIETRTQIDCEGFDYFDAPRLAEFVFLNDELAMVWILVDAEALPQLEEALVQLHGAADVTSEMVDLHTSANAGVRRDVPEALFYSEAIEPLVRAQAGG